jgi:hypothetical protein
MPCLPPKSDGQMLTLLACRRRRLFRIERDLIKDYGRQLQIIKDEIK